MAPREPLIPAQRRGLILDAVAREGVASIAALTRTLGVSHMTVRRDIRHLEAEGRVSSTAGGVRLPERLAAEPSRAAKQTWRHAQKAAIGAAAAAMVPRGAVVYLDAGTTAEEIADRLAPRDDLLIVTNDFAVCRTLARSGCRLHFAGGTVDRANRSCVGPGAADAIRRYAFDIAFLSAASWSLRGVTTPAEEKVDAKRAAVDCAARTILVADSSKYGLVGAFLAAPLERLAGVVTDDGVPPPVVEALRARGLDVILAPIGATTQAAAETAAGETA